MGGIKGRKSQVRLEKRLSGFGNIKADNSGSKTTSKRNGDHMEFHKPGSNKR